MVPIAAEFVRKCFYCKCIHFMAAKFCMRVALRGIFAWLFFPKHTRLFYLYYDDFFHAHQIFGLSKDMPEMSENMY